MSTDLSDDLDAHVIARRFLQQRELKGLLAMTLPAMGCPLGTDHFSKHPVELSFVPAGLANAALGS
jgi:hypothetical protein